LLFGKSRKGFKYPFEASGFHPFCEMNFSPPLNSAFKPFSSREKKRRRRKREHQNISNSKKAEIHLQRKISKVS
jgi:hypothetical protein